MTRKRKIKRIIGFFFTISIVVYVYYFHLANPSSFLTSEEILSDLNRHSYDLKANEVLEMIEIDTRHMYVPFMTKDNKYGMGLWKWEKHKWTLIAESDNGAPQVLKIKPDDPSSYKIYWNIHPDDDISYGELYFIRDRNYHMTEGNDNYFPRIQMKTIINFEDIPYGVLDLPSEWQEVMQVLVKIEEAKEPVPFNNGFFPVLHDIYFGWISYNNEHERQRPDKTHRGRGSSSGIELQHVMYLNEEQLE